MNKAVTIKTTLASDHPSDCLWGKHDFGRKFLVAALCWLLAGLWRWLFLLYCFLKTFLMVTKITEQYLSVALEVLHNNGTKILQFQFHANRQSQEFAESP